MIVYIDNDYKCHLNNADGRREFNVPFFNGKCKILIEGFRYVPKGETWTREDGEAFHGEMISAWKDYSLLAMAQEAFEEANDIALQEIANLIDEIYNEDLAFIG